IPNSITYFSYNKANNEWLDKSFICQNCDTGGGADVDIDNEYNPHIAWHQRTIGSGIDDSTMYIWFNGNWSEPELVVNDPYEQKITIDPYNRVHILDREKLETGTKLVHYQKINDMWQGYIIDEAINSVGMPSLLKTDDFIYLVYTYSAEINNGDILFTKYDILTELRKEFDLSGIEALNIFPNPFKTQTTIEFTTAKEQYINVSIYNLNGQHIKTLMNENTVRGEYRLIWKGKGKHGKEVSVIPGLYLVRLQSGRKIVTKAVEYIR
ncbi:MAG: T9SS type A sorting domain-containing protein, partial [Bacteroidales bacterium]|nr:T9SS type A sorting domain-containing protein [Bacteroidales bacterium]